MPTVIRARPYAYSIQASKPIGIRIGELARRVGVSPATLRAWERRYGLLDPDRSQAGQRLYGAVHERRVLRMKALIASGLQASVAARLAIQEEPPEERPAEEEAGLDTLARALAAALEGFDDGAANAVLDRILAGFEVDTVLADVVMPYLRRLRDRTGGDPLTLAKDQFAVRLLGGRLREQARAWDVGSGPRALLALAPGEDHELGLLCMGLALRARGWRVTWLGAGVRATALAGAADHLSPNAVVVSAAREDQLLAAERELRAVGGRHRLFIGGPAARAELAQRLGAASLGNDPVAAAEWLTVGARP